MQTRRAKNYRVLRSESGAESYEFVLSEGKEIAVLAEFYSEWPFTVFYRVQHSFGAYDVPMAVGVHKFLVDERLSGVAMIWVQFDEKATLLQNVSSKAIGIAPMDTTPMEITSQLPAPTMEEIIRREFNKRFPKPRDKRAEENFDAEDEVLVRAGGADYSIDDEDPDDPLQVTAADVAAARSRKRKRASDGVQPVDGGSNTGKDPDRGGSAESPPVEPSNGGEPKT